MIYPCGQFFSAIITGGRTIIYPNRLILDPHEFLLQLIRDRVTILEVVPSYLAALLDSPETPEPSQLPFHYLLVTGEEVKPHLVSRWFRTYPDIRMVNAYGPTEASDDITHHIMGHAPEVERIPIGKPLQNLNIYIVDSRMQLCPIGVKGEICVSGVGVGRGYMGDEEKTRLVFTHDPFSQQEGIRLYKTGDLGRWLADGTIEFFGRKDYQVKIRGFRIELGEIENRLLENPGIDKTVVIDREDKFGNKYLCAYIVLHSPRGGDSVESSKLKEFLSQSLPEYMIPEHFMQLQRIPLTSNGKVDRKALPAPGEDEVFGTYQPPTNPIETELVEIWAEVLGKSKDIIGIEHNFFQLGGHSLKAILLVSRIHKAFHIKLPLAQLFTVPTIRGLSRYIKKAGTERYSSIEAVEKREYYDLSSAQKRLYVLQQMEVESTAYNLPEVIPLWETFDPDKLEETFIKLIARHESLRTSFQMVDNHPVQCLMEPSDTRFEIEHYDTQTHDSSFIFNRFSSPFDLTRAPLLRAGVVKSGEGTFLVVVMHHIISDATSHGVLVNDFKALYQGTELPPLRIQYKDFSSWQNNEKQAGRLNRQETFWLGQFDDEIPVLNLQTDYPRPTVQRFEGNAIQFKIEPEHTQALKIIAREQAVTFFMLMLSLSYILISKLSSQEDIIIGTPVSGRRHADLETIIGMFVNTLALRNRPQGNKSVKTFLAEVKTQTLDSFENQEFPFEELVDKVDITRDISRNPLFDFMFSLQEIENSSPTPDPAKNEHSPVEHETGHESEQDGSQYGWRISKFDLGLDIRVEETLTLEFEYSTALFKEETIQRFTRYFKALVQAVTVDIDTKISALEIISEQEKKQLLSDFNDTALDYPKDKSIHLLFEEQVERTPDSIALIGGWHELKGERDVSLTYRQLNTKAGQLAVELTKTGVGPDTIVGTIVPRSVEMIAAILGILKAGGAYLPIDSGYPDERIRYILADSDTRVIVSSGDVIPSIGEGWKRKSLDSFIINRLDGSGSTVQPVSRPVPKSPHPTNLAYIIYTSGTTGMPKGVLVEHCNVVTYVHAYYREFNINSSDATIQVSSYFFDSFVEEVFSLFIDRGTGGDTIGLPDHRRSNPFATDR